MEEASSFNSDPAGHQQASSFSNGARYGFVVYIFHRAPAMILPVSVSMTLTQRSLGLALVSWSWRSRPALIASASADGPEPRMGNISSQGACGGFVHAAHWQLKSSSKSFSRLTSSTRRGIAAVSRVFGFLRALLDFEHCNVAVDEA